MNFTSSEMNLLVYRYLMESGFKHSGFIFANESKITETRVNGELIPSGALIDIVEKGLKFTEAQVSAAQGKESVSLSIIDAVMPDVIEKQVRPVATNAEQKTKQQDGQGDNDMEVS